ncbi:MAG: ATP-binding protein [Pseudomonadota bacterium]
MSAGDGDAIPPFSGEPPWESLFIGLATQAQIDTEGRGEAALLQWFKRNPMFAGPLAVSVIGPDRQLIYRIPGSDDDLVETPLFKSVAIDRQEGRYDINIQARQLASIPNPNRAQRYLASVALRPDYYWWVFAVALAISIALSMILARYLVKPLRLFERAGRRLAAGDLAVRVSPGLGSRDDEIAQFASTFDQMAVQIQRLVRSHQHLLRDVSHELRTPLARVLAAASLARQETAQMATVEFDRIELEVRKLNDMIGRLLTYAQLDAPEATIAMGRVAFDELVSATVDDAQIEAEVAGKSIRLAARDACEVLGSSDLLISTVDNVLRNAVRHSPDGGCVEVRLHRSVADQRCQLEIRDHGDGVASDDLSRIFDPFFQTDPARAPGSGGIGIGLAIAARAMQLHNGSIRAANSAKGSGLVVTILMPLADL